MMGTGEASGERRAIIAAEEAITNPLLDDVSLRGARGLLLSIIGGQDMTLYEVDEAASRIRQEVDPEANIIVGASFDEQMGDRSQGVDRGLGNGKVERRCRAASTGDRWRQGGRSGSAIGSADWAGDQGQRQDWSTVVRSSANRRRTPHQCSSSGAAPPPLPGNLPAPSLESGCGHSLQWLPSVTRRAALGRSCRRQKMVQHIQIGWSCVWRGQDPAGAGFDRRFRRSLVPATPATARAACRHIRAPSPA